MCGGGGGGGVGVERWRWGGESSVLSSKINLNPSSVKNQHILTNALKSLRD